VQVLKGLRATIKASNALAALIEVWPRGLEMAGASADELVRLCSAHGMRPHLVEPGGALCEIEWGHVLSLSRAAEQKPDDIGYFNILAVK
jgi:hypothetical protein